MSQKTKIAVFGGAFDPPHAGHSIYISNILNSNLVDQVWIVPTGEGRYDKNAHASAEHRKKLLEIFMLSEFSSQDRVKLITDQVQADGNDCATIELLDNFKKLYPQYEFLFVVGSDNVSKISSWREGERLLAEYKFLVLVRNLQDKQDESASFQYLRGEEIVQCSVSSTLIRNLIAKQKCIGGLISSSLIQYINDHKLYRVVPL